MRNRRWIGLGLSPLLALAVACGSSATPAPRAAGAGEAASARLPPLWPPPLSPGDTIMFVAPAGAVERERMAIARERLESLGYRVVERDDLYAEEGFLAGSDERRADELMQAFLDPEVDAVYAGTGGYGAMRILDRLDFAAIRRNPKPFIGFSDITALHAALSSRAGLVTFHGPMPMGLFGGAGFDPLDFSPYWFLRAIAESPAGVACDYTVDAAAESPVPFALARGRARGRLVGGNLTLVAALEGTPYAVETRGKILLLEDVREAPYRVDRMLRQLELAGRLDGLAGAVLGQFTRDFDREDAPRNPDPRYTTDGVLRRYFERRGIPVLMNFPIGHHAMNATLPIGGLVEIDADVEPPALRILRSADDGR